MKKIKMRMLKAWGPFQPGQIVIFAESKAKWAISDGVAEIYKISKAELKAKTKEEADAKAKAKAEAKEKAEAEAKAKAEAETAMVEPVAETADIRPFSQGNKKKRR